MRRSRTLAMGLAWAVGAMGFWVLANPPALGGWAAALGDAVRSVGNASLPGMPLRQGALLLSTIVFLAFNLSMAAAGGICVRLAGPNCLKSFVFPARIGIVLPLGWGLTGSLLFGLGCCGLFKRSLLAVLLLGGAGLAWGAVRGTGRGKLRTIRAFRPRAIAARLCAALLLAALSVTAACALAPQTEIDSLIHNLPVASRLLSLGSLVPLPDNSAFHVGALAEMLRGFSMGLGGEPAANLFNALGVALAALLLAGLLRPLTGEGWAWFAAAACCANSFAFLLGQTSKPDLLLFCPGLAVLALAARGTGPLLLLAGLLLGCATAIKYSAGLLAPVLLGILVIRRNPHVLIFAAAAALPLVPWLAKSWLLTGNPVFPFAYGIFGGLGLDPAGQEKLMWFAGNVLHADYYDSLPRRLGALWTLTIRDGAPPAWLVLLPLALLAREPRGWRISWRLAIAGFLALWTAGPIQFRYLAPVLPAIIFLGTLGLAQCRIRAAVLLAGGLLLIQGGNLSLRPEASARILAGLGLEQQTAFFKRILPQYAEALERIRKLSGHGRIICLGHAAAYPMPDTLMTSAVNRQFAAYPILQASGSVEDLRRKLRQIGATHLLYNPPHAIYMRHLKSGVWNEREVGLWAGFWRGNAREIFRSSGISRRYGFYVLYSLSGEACGEASFSFLPGLEYGLAAVEELWMKQRYAQAEELLELIGKKAGDFGSFSFFKGHFLRFADPDTALSCLRSAEKAGYWDVVLWEDLEELGRGLNKPGLARTARGRLQALAREE